MLVDEASGRKSTGLVPPGARKRLASVSPRISRWQIRNQETNTPTDITNQSWINTDGEPQKRLQHSCCLGYRRP
jgi:hypothetical protein